MKWFKHISDSLDDPFIFDLMDRFDADGYLVFFGILEIYSREFKPELNWNLCITRAYLRQKLHKRQDTLVIKILKHIQNSGKWNIVITETEVSILIPKFTEILDDWTIRKLRSNSVVTPKILTTDKEEDKEVDTDKEKKDILPKGNKSSDSPDDDKCPHKDIIKLYHEILPTMPKVKEWTKERSKIMRSRWKEKQERQTLEWWSKFFSYVSESDFLMGRIKPEFQADLEWLVRPKNFVKVIEGKYHRQGSTLISRSSQEILGWAERKMQREGITDDQT